MCQIEFSEHHRLQIEMPQNLSVNQYLKTPFGLAVVLLHGLNGNRSCGLTHRKHSLWVSLCSHVGVMNLLQNHPAFVVFAILCVKKGNVTQRVTLLSCYDL